MRMKIQLWENLGERQKEGDSLQFRWSMASAARDRHDCLDFESSRYSLTMVFWREQGKVEMEAEFYQKWQASLRIELDEYRNRAKRRGGDGPKHYNQRWKEKNRT